MPGEGRGPFFVFGHYFVPALVVQAELPEVVEHVFVQLVTDVLREPAVDVDGLAGVDDVGRVIVAALGHPRVRRRIDRHLRIKAHEHKDVIRASDSLPASTCC